MIKKPLQKSLLNKVEKNIKKNKLIEGGEQVIVAVSGGVDSVCLFDILCKLKEKLGISLLACHYNHRMRGEESYNDEEFVKNLCQKRGIECLVGRAEKDNLYKNEEEARVARYAFFEKILNERGEAKIALAHNANDSAETLLMRMARGTGIRGLMGIPRQRENFIRPLLPFSRDEIKKYLSCENIVYRTDKTNADVAFTRNFIRHIIIPELKKLNPNVVETLASSSEVIKEDYEFIYKVARAELKRILVEKSLNTIVLDRKKWLLLDPAISRLAIRLAIAELGKLDDITNKQLSEVCEVVIRGEGKKHKLLPHSLRVDLVSGKIVISYLKNNSL